MVATAVRRDVFAAVDNGYAVRLDGTCSLNGGPDVACRAVRISLVAMTVRVDASGARGDTVVLQLPQIGIVEARIAESYHGGFDLSFEPAPRSKLGTYLAWLGDAKADRDGREHERIVPIKRLTTLKRDGQPPTMARIVDLSRSGAAFTCSKSFTVGERAELGKLSGSIVRLKDGGAAIRFDHVIDDRAFGLMIDLDAIPA